MVFYDPVTWVPYLPWLLVAYIVWDAWAPTFYRGDSHYFITPTAVVGIVYVLARNWTGLKISKIVPEPYLDEIFHIPQAQAYCAGDFHIWDPKLTTPPGLYAFTTIFCNLAQIRNCDVDTLRWFNNIALVFAMVYAGSCYASIARLGGLRNLNVLHNMFNFALFPPLFFFSGLYYTDVLSTCVVLKMYRDFLNNRSGIWLYFTGIVALTMRQTNIFWTAVFLGGLEAVRTLKTFEAKPDKKRAPMCFKGIVRATFHQYERGEIHDIALKDVELEDFFLCALSIAIAVIFHPLLITKKIWPYVAILLSFGYFVFWNGGVVLGDKENHVATLHLPQVLYLWPFISFFSLPLLIPSILQFLYCLFTRQLPTSKPVIILGRKFHRIVHYFAHVCTAWLFSFIVIMHNTIIHPFTLADNRHYMFYVFRYTILRHPIIKYLLGPVYIITFYLCYTTLSASFTSFTSLLPAFNNPEGKKTLAEIQRSRKAHKIETGEIATTSFFIIWFGATALSLITAPLVEPRYFILPWIIFRLHVPSLTFPTSASNRAQVQKGRAWHADVSRSWKEVKEVVRWYGWEGHDPRLWVETAWFVAINAVTGYVFLNKGFEWPQEPGKVQRFMW